ncbi:MAG: phytanoyl-CoA dioxygenase family protein [Pseudomonadota bacterium]|jgi:ectoine hydroxylase-related dioxygenase (phytanoyl-CoA dioxygenase family)|nr:phytanoyl-CoA dioxygenase family protein [Pseudomonadota bacterium]|tara:strand:- start:1941 stop:2837 length:897 start_codon:yes stop_codon:yes gene_type:complete
MAPEEILKNMPRFISRKQQESYFDNGYLLIENAISSQILCKLQDSTAQAIDDSRQVTQSDATWDLEPGHRSDNPRLRRLTSPNDYDDTYWAYASSETITEILSDLIGPDIKFHHSKLNFKWAGGGEEVKWHQDISFWPHTNYTPCTVGLYLEDCSDEQGPLGVIAGSHKGPLFDQYNEDNQWIGCLSDEDVMQLDMSRETYLPGPAGSITIHNCRTVHGSRINRLDRPRPLLLNAYAAADAMTYTFNPARSKYDQRIVRGQAARWARHDPEPCLLPPDWSGGYTSIFALQQQEESHRM